MWVLLSIPDSSLFKKSDFIDASNAKCLVLTFVLVDCSIFFPPRCFTHLFVCAFLSFIRGCLLICLFKSVCACSVTNGYWNNKNTSYVGRKKRIPAEDKSFLQFQVKRHFNRKEYRNFYIFPQSNKNISAGI